MSCFCFLRGIQMEGKNIEQKNLVVDIKTDDIESFPEHPFKIYDNEEMDLMVESVLDHGLIHPVIVRPLPNGKYQMISGHRRKHAYEKAGIKSIPAIVKNLSDDDATILMVDSNMQREEILPSERAFAYKMKLDAMKHQGKRVDLTSAHNEKKLESAVFTDVLENELTCTQDGHKLENKKSIQILAEQVNESKTQIQRYIRLTYLIPELLQMVDENKIAMLPAVELSYLKKEEQEIVADNIKDLDSTPSHGQARTLKSMSLANKLTPDFIDELMAEDKPNQKPQFKIDETRFNKVIPAKYKTPKEKEDYLYMCAEEHRKREERKKSLAR